MALRVLTPAASVRQRQALLSAEIELAYALHGFVCCDGCMDVVEIAEPFDPGCSYGCGFTSLPAPACHSIYCSERCFDNSNERAAEAEYRHAHEG